MALEGRGSVSVSKGSGRVGGSGGGVSAGSTARKQDWTQYSPKKDEEEEIGSGGVTAGMPTVRAGGAPDNPWGVTLPAMQTVVNPNTPRTWWDQQTVVQPGATVTNTGTQMSLANQDINKMSLAGGGTGTIGSYGVIPDEMGEQTQDRTAPPTTWSGLIEPENNAWNAPQTQMVNSPWVMNGMGVGIGAGAGFPPAGPRNTPRPTVAPDMAELLRQEAVRPTGLAEALGLNNTKNLLGGYSQETMAGYGASPDTMIGQVQTGNTLAAQSAPAYDWYQMMLKNRPGGMKAPTKPTTTTGTGTAKTWSGYGGGGGGGRGYSSSGSQSWQDYLQNVMWKV